MHSLTCTYLVGQPLALLLCLGLLASSVPLLTRAQALALPQAPGPREPLPDRQLTLSVGAVHNRYDDLATVGYSPAPTIYRHQSNAGGAEAAYQWAPKAGHPFDAVGGGVWAGSETLAVYKDPAGNVGKAPSTLFGNHTLYALHVYAEGHKLTARHQLDFTYRLGWYAGQLAHHEDTFQSNTLATTTLLPEFMNYVKKQGSGRKMG
jgi:hypothetical protein